MIIKGNLHPLTQFLRDAIKIFEDLGFDVYEGPEVDSEWYNFDSLNFPKDHPARDMQDTFFLTNGKLLRTHTSNCQVRYGETHRPPIKAVFPGRVYRNEATDAKHETTFVQLEGLYIDKDVKVGHLIWTLEKFFQTLFGDDTKIRIKPSYFPFVEPGFEVDVKYQGKWFELLGAGMVHPNVIKNMKLDSDKYSGFAFGMGIDRLAILKYGIEDIRLFNSGNLQFLKQFQNG
jgi:phenylalanyl-tRNA synthetase alpha chain